MKLENLKIGQTVKLDTFYHTKELFKIIGFTPKRVKVIRISTGNKYSWFIKNTSIIEVVA
jgi:hypothetical protein